jgi:hypothetical protein
MYRFKEDDFVEFTLGDHYGCGYIKGVSVQETAKFGSNTARIPDVKTTYIIQWESFRGPKGIVNHRYSCITVPEQFIKLVEE